MKRICFGFICAIVFVFSFHVIALASTELALGLRELGMFMGISENEEEIVDFDLDRAPTRTEALIMLIRVLGKDDSAAVYPKTHPFRDVPKWADGYVSYAYDKGLTAGISDTLFDANGAVTEEIYLTFLLRALGYKDGGGGDFHWDSPWALAAWAGILPEIKRSDFLRTDMVSLTCAALYANLKGTTIPLYEKLISEAAFTDTQFYRAFPEDPFSRCRLIDKRVSDFIREHEHLGMYTDNTFAIESHIITEIREENNVVFVSVLVGIGLATLGEEDIESFSWQTGLWLIELDSDSLQYRSCKKAEEIRSAGHELEEYFSENTLKAQSKLAEGMDGAGRLIIQEQIDSGLIGYTKPTYERSMEKVSNAPFFYVVQTIEAEPCSILIGQTGGIPHSGGTYMYLIYKPGSAKGEGEGIPLPLPAANAWGTPAVPEELNFDESSLILSYSVHFDESMVVDGHTYHEAGTYIYTVDLVKGEVTGEVKY